MSGMEFTDLKGRYRRATWQVTPELTVPASAGKARFLHRYGLPVLASAELIRLVEDTCWSAMLPLVDSDQGIVGYRFDMLHKAPAAPGDFVEIEMACLVAEERAATWSGTVTNLRTGKVVGEIEHDAAVVNWQEFMAKAAPHLAITDPN